MGVLCEQAGYEDGFPQSRAAMGSGGGGLQEMDLESIQLTAHEALPPPAALELEVAPLSIPAGLPPLHTGSLPRQPSLWCQAVAEPCLRASTELLGEPLPRATCSDEILQRFSSLSAVSSATDSYAWN